MFGVLVGAKGSTKKRIQFETKTTIKIPKHGADGPVEVIGPTRQSVVSARRRMELIIMAARHKQDKTHFLCVPVTDQNIRERFVQFKVIVFGPTVTYAQKETYFHLSESNSTDSINAWNR